MSLVSRYRRIVVRRSSNLHLFPGIKSCAGALLSRPTMYT